MLFVDPKEAWESKFTPLMFFGHTGNTLTIVVRELTCRCGAGKEVTAGTGDTLGFKIRDVAAVVNEHQRCLKLHMLRNHPRVNQTSHDLIQTWIGNCDIQIMIYESDPDNFNLREISKVTDYIVAYSCKGNATLWEETENNQRLILGTEEKECASK